MSKELVEQHVQLMVDEVVKLTLESRLASLKAISLAISDALGDLWWTAGADAKQRIRRVQELAQEIRNEDAITVEPTLTAELTVPGKPRQESHRRRR